MLTQQLSPRMVRCRLCSCGLTRRNIWEQTVTSRLNQPRHVFWCRQKLSWKADNWKSVEFIDETQIVIWQDKKVKATYGEGYMKSGISNVL